MNPLENAPWSVRGLFHVLRTPLKIKSLRGRIWGLIFRVIFLTGFTVAIITGQAALALAAGLTIPSGSTLKVNTGTLNVAGDIINEGTLLLTTGTITDGYLSML